jgi:hypothetical protein
MICHLKATQVYYSALVKFSKKILSTPNIQLNAYAMEERTFRNVNYYFNTNIYSYLETSGGQSSYLYSKIVHFLNTSVNKTSVAA